MQWWRRIVLISAYPKNDLPKKKAFIRNVFTSMYINWAHHYIPKVGGVCSFFINILFIKIAKDERKVRLGNYRFLLLFFAFYNLVCTASDALVPICVLNHKNAFSVFVADGYFEKKSYLGTLVLSIRCSLIPASYGILHSHFIYRYIVLFHRKKVMKYFIPYGLVMSITYCFLLSSLWFVASYFFVMGEEERRIYLESGFREILNVDVHDLNILIALFDEASRETVHQSWIGIIIVSLISIDSVLIYFIFGSLIIIKIYKNDLTMNKKTRYLQKQLMKALAVQASIPMLVSFLPCLCVWYFPVLKIDIGQWIYWISSIAISFFPALDPLSLFYFIPAFRKRVIEILHVGDVQSAISVISGRSSKTSQT